MRRHVVRIAFISVLLSSGLAAQELAKPQVPRDTKLPELIELNAEYFAKVGKARGSGWRQHTRQMEFISRRNFPDGDATNFPAMTWLNYFRPARTPQFQASKSAAAASGIVANWAPVRPTEEQQGTDAGRINAISFDPNDPKAVYVGTPAGGVWRTLDDGATWTSLTDALPMLAVSDIAIDPLNPKTIYVLTGDGEGDPRGSP